VLVDPLGKMAQDLNTTKALMFTLAAKEGGWIKEHLDHNQPLNNPFGVNRIKYGRAAGNVNYPSLDAAIEYWKQRFGDRVRGTQTPDAFINGLERPAQGAPYNRNVEQYTKAFMDVYNSSRVLCFERQSAGRLACFTVCQTNLRCGGSRTRLQVAVAGDLTGGSVGDQILPMDLFGGLSKPVRKSMTPVYLPSLVGNRPQRPEDRRM